MVGNNAKIKPHEGSKRGLSMPYKLRWYQYEYIADL